MRIYNPLRLKKFVRDRLNLTRIGQRIDDLYAEKADFQDYRTTQRQLSEIADALHVLYRAQLGDPVPESLRQSLAMLKESIGSDEDAITPDTSMVFICGLHRSGTSLLTKVLQRCGDIGGFAGTRATEDEGQHLQSVYPSDRDLGHVGSFGFDPEAHVTESSVLVSDHRRRKLARQWSRHLQPGKKCYVEKSPPNLLKTRYLQAMFPNSKFIVIRRHPIATCLATEKWNRSWLPSLMRHWLHCYETWASDRGHIRHHYELKYEDFVARPRATLASIGGFLGLDDLDKHCLPCDDHEVSRGVNDRYFEIWGKRGIERHLSRFLYEERVRRFGYSLSLD